MQKIQNSKTGSDNRIEQMFEAGAHYGYSKTRRHPSVSSYIHTTKNKTDIIDLEKTALLLDKAVEFALNLGAKNKTLLFVGTKPEAKEIIKYAAESIGMPYVHERWIGGTISNFGEIKKRINELEEYRKDLKEGTLDKYTKKERLLLSKKMQKLERYYAGLVGMKKIPDALFVVDAKKEHIATTEAQKSNIKVIALVNSDSNIKNIDFPIVGNDAAIPSIKLFTNSIINAYKEGAKDAPTKA